MTAVVSAAADALDLSGAILHAEVAPDDFGVLVLPQPIYYRHPMGLVTGIAAITWATRSTGTRGWSDQDDPDDPEMALIRETLRRHRKVRGMLGPYLLADIDHLPVDDQYRQPRRLT